MWANWLDPVTANMMFAMTRPVGPLPGPISNIASCNYPISVQVHAESVQALTGNDGGEGPELGPNTPNTLPDAGVRVRQAPPGRAHHTIVRLP
jgi:hypothetical protein